MKRYAVLSVAVIVMVMAAASAAYAIGPAYVDWTSGGANAGSLATPHKDYQLTTEKCAVCHSVHAAGWYRTSDNTTDGVVTSGDRDPNSASEMLLRGSVANACSYCHIETAIGGKQIYDGVVTNYNGQTPFAHNGDPGNASCAGCHAVHGAATMGGAVESKILKSGATGVANDARFYQPAAVDTLGGGDPAVIDASANRNLQITAYCTKCHPTFSDASEQVVSTNGYFVDGNGGYQGFGIKFYSNHPLKVVGGEVDASGTPSAFIAQGATVATSTQVAFVDSQWCRSCHAAGVDGSTVNLGVITSSFPHDTPGNSNFLIAGEDAMAAASGVASGTQGEDGVCLRCHRDGSGGGIGLNF